MTAPDDDRKSNRIMHVGFGYLSRFAAVAAILTALAVVLGYAALGWFGPTVLGAVALLTHMVSVKYRPEVGR